jgi:hypothetical protein
MNGLMESVSRLFKHQNDLVRQAAAISLGIISIGNTNFFLGKVFGMIDKSPVQEKYMFLSTVREIIMINPQCLTPYLKNLMPLYLI